MLEVRNISHSFNGQDKILDDISLEIKEKKIYSLKGESGSGKSTLLQILGGLLRPSEGQVLFEGKDISLLSEKEKAYLRSEKIAFVFQEFFLFPNLTVLENIKIPLLFSKKKKIDLEEVMDLLGILDIKNSLASEISGGQKQRTSIARSLVNSPKIIFADEPTGNLDTKNTRATIDLFKTLNKKKNVAFLIATHDEEISKNSEKVFRICDGKLN